MGSFKETRKRLNCQDFHFQWSNCLHTVWSFRKSPQQIKCLAHLHASWKFKLQNKLTEKEEGNFGGKTGDIKITVNRGISCCPSEGWEFPTVSLGLSQRVRMGSSCGIKEKVQQWEEEDTLFSRFWQKQLGNPLRLNFFHNPSAAICRAKRLD